jgi:hypothetical protein
LVLPLEEDDSKAVEAKEMAVINALMRMDLGTAVGVAVGIMVGIMVDVAIRAGDVSSLHPAVVDLKHLMMGSKWIRISSIKCLQSSELLFTKDANLCVPPTIVQAHDLSLPWVVSNTSQGTISRSLLMVKPTLK